jgi:hypothetical protein
MLKDLLLQKGWAGKTISRAETVERINPIIRQFLVLNHHYDALIRSMPDGPLRGQLDAAQKTARMDVGKLAETVFSCGGTAYSGTDLELEAFAAADNRSAAIEQLADLEKSFIELIDGESSVDHQMRTRAILSVVKTNAETRLELLKNSGR